MRALGLQLEPLGRDWSLGAGIEAWGWNWGLEAKIKATKPGGMDKEKKGEKREEEKFPHKCESLGHRHLRDCCQKRVR